VDKPSPQWPVSLVCWGGLLQLARAPGAAAGCPGTAAGLASAEAEQSLHCFVQRAATPAVPVGLLGAGNPVAHTMHRVRYILQSLPDTQCILHVIVIHTSWCALPVWCAELEPVSN
jgi:hypothetical protein